jgi:hypothetical protein
MGFVPLTGPTAGFTTTPGLDTTMLTANPDYAFLNASAQQQVTQSTATAGMSGMEGLAQGLLVAGPIMGIMGAATG